MDCLSTSTVQNKKNICANLDDVGEASALVRMERLVHPVGQPCCQHAHLPVVPPFNKRCSASTTLTLTTILQACPSARGTTFQQVVFSINTKQEYIYVTITNINNHVASMPICSWYHLSTSGVQHQHKAGVHISLSPSPTLTLTTILQASPSARGTTCLWLILPWTDDCCKY